MAEVEAVTSLPVQDRFNIGKYLLESLGFVFIAMGLIIILVWVMKGRPRQLSIRDSLILIFFVYGALIIASSAFVILLLQTQEHAEEIQSRHIESLNLAWELKQSSDDLTRLVRTYAVTGDPKYEHYFRTIMAIRDGKKPHPKYFRPVLLGLRHRRRHGTGLCGKTYNFEERMDDLGLSEKEISTLLEAKKESDDLIRLENRAMNAVKGLYKDKNSRFTIKGNRIWPWRAIWCTVRNIMLPRPKL